jgi:tight adherence protein B
VRAGGRGLVDVLDGLARSLREEIAVRRHAEADRAKPRANMRSLVIITLVVVAGLSAFAREYLAPLDSAVGQLVLATVLAIFAGGFVWMHRLTRPRQSGLFLESTLPQGGDSGAAP